MTAKNKDAALVDFLASGFSHREAARLSGVSESTVTRRLRSVEFNRAVEEASQERAQRIAGTLTAGAARAALLLAQIVDDRNVAPAVRVRAAGLLLREQGQRVLWASISERLEALEVSVSIR